MCSPISHRIIHALALLLTIASFVSAQAQDLRPREGNLKVGDVAPDFELKYEAKDKTGTVKLSSFKGKQPMVLVFGSYT